MANREVNLTKRVQTSQGMRYCRVVLSANGRVKPDVVRVNGSEERTLKGPTTSNGGKGQSGSVYLWARMLRMRLQSG